MSLERDGSFSSVLGRGDLRSGLKRSIQVRWGVILGLSLMVLTTAPLSHPLPLLQPLLTLMLGASIVNMLYYSWLQSGKRLLLLAYTEIVGDTLVVTGLIHYTGGVDSPFTWTYVPIILSASILLHQRAGMVAALLSSLLLAMELGMEYYAMIPHRHVGILAVHYEAMYRDHNLIALLISMNTILYWSVAGLSGYLAHLAEARRHALGLALDRLQQLHYTSARTQERERRRIALELHDGMGQTLSALILRLEVLRESLSARRRHEKSNIEEIRQLAVKASEDIDNLVFRLRPTVLDDLGLVPALRSYLKSFCNGISLEVGFKVRGEVHRLSSETETALFRIVQEALTNVLKHADAKKVTIELFYDTDILLVIHDDGKGFDVQAQLSCSERKGLGLLGIQERVTMLQGTFEIYSEPENGGTRIKVSIPLGENIGGEHRGNDVDRVGLEEESR
ncbi:MAG: sensor histidine kinase [Firmicutes bacterium]|nr:sensor histidine kinase [Bacillota bacterium]